MPGRTDNSIKNRFNSALQKGNIRLLGNTYTDEEILQIVNENQFDHLSKVKSMAEDMKAV